VLPVVPHTQGTQDHTVLPVVPHTQGTQDHTVLPANYTDVQTKVKGKQYI